MLYHSWRGQNKGLVHSGFYITEVWPFYSFVLSLNPRCQALHPQLLLRLTRAFLPVLASGKSKTLKPQDPLTQYTLRPRLPQRWRYLILNLPGHVLATTLEDGSTLLSVMLQLLAEHYIPPNSHELFKK